MYYKIDCGIIYFTTALGVGSLFGSEIQTMHFTFYECKKWNRFFHSFYWDNNDYTQRNREEKNKKKREINPKRRMISRNNEFHDSHGEQTISNSSGWKNLMLKTWTKNSNSMMISNRAQYEIQSNSIYEPNCHLFH